MWSSLLANDIPDHSRFLIHAVVLITRARCKLLRCTPTAEWWTGQSDADSRWIRANYALWHWALNWLNAGQNYCRSVPTPITTNQRFLDPGSLLCRPRCMSTNAASPSLVCKSGSVASVQSQSCRGSFLPIDSETALNWVPGSLVIGSSAALQVISFHLPNQSRINSKSSDCNSGCG